jgi:hypothetical protein
MPPDKQSPRGVTGGQDGGEHVSKRITERWLGTILYSAEPERGREPLRGLADALDHLDELGLCACWTAPRRHRRAA